MRDDHYKNMCEHPSEYDATINWIKNHNPYAAKAPEGPEDFAVKSVHDCIRAVLYGDAGAFCSTGMCLAVRVSSRPDLPGYKKVVLGIRL